MYAMLGLPLCVGSIDATFIPWEATSKNLRNVCNGDKGKGLLFDVVVTHMKEVLAIEGSYYCTINDKTSVKYNGFIDDLKSHKIYKDLSYKIRTGPNEEDYVELSSCYVIADGGYLEWSVLITGYGISGDPVKYKFTDWVASVRKDVECFFQLLKGRFRLQTDIYIPKLNK
jgi:hypothetical protein